MRSICGGRAWMALRSAIFIARTIWKPCKTIGAKSYMSFRRGKTRMNISALTQTVARQFAFNDSILSKNFQPAQHRLNSRADLFDRDALHAGVTLAEAAPPFAGMRAGAAGERVRNHAGGRSVRIKAELFDSGAEQRDNRPPHG